jgi:flagellar basal body-associated protein FliL
VFWNSLLRYGI